jgi:hypothetical protein
VRKGGWSDATMARVILGVTAESRPDLQGFHLGFAPFFHGVRLGGDYLGLSILEALRLSAHQYGRPIAPAETASSLFALARLIEHYPHPPNTDRPAHARTGGDDPLALHVPPRHGAGRCRAVGGRTLRGHRRRHLLFPPTPDERNPTMNDNSATDLPALIPHCRDCGAAIGHPHDERCCVARCLATGLDRSSHPATCPCPRDIWDGRYPGTVECSVLGWLIPPGLPDLNRLYTEAEWDAEQCQWLKRTP